MAPKRRRVDVLADGTMRACLSGLLGSALLLAVALTTWGSAGWRPLNPAPAALLLFLAAAAAGCLLLARRRLAAVRRLVRAGTQVRAEVLGFDQPGWRTGTLRVAYRHGGRDFRRDIPLMEKEGRPLAEAGEVCLLVDPADPTRFAVAMPD